MAPVYVTVIIDLTPVLEGTGRARLLDLIPGRSAAALYCHPRHLLIDSEGTHDLVSLAVRPAGSACGSVRQP